MMKSANQVVFILVVFICSLGLIHSSFANETLRLHVWDGYAPEGKVEKFENYIQQKYNRVVKLEISYISDPNDFFEQIRGKKVDIISPGHNLLKDARFNFIKNKILLPLDLNNIPNYKNLISNLQNAEYSYQDGKVYAVPFAHGPYGLAYNTAHLNAPDSWGVFWDPKYKDKYTISLDYYEANIYITALAMGYSVNELATAENLNNPKFKKKLRELAQNSSVMWEGIDTADILQNNSIAAVWGFSLPELAKRGQVWKIAEPKEGTMGWVDNFAIGWSLKNKPFLRKVAEEWLNFVISPDFQVEVTVRSLGSAPTNTHIQDRLTLEEIAMFHINDPDYFQNNRILWPTLKRTRDRNFMKHLWEKALIKNK